MGRTVLWLVLLPCCCCLGCHTVAPAGPPDPLVEAVLKEAAQKRAPGPNAAGDLAADLAAVVLKEVPLQTPLDKARPVLERHGFSCWSGVQDDKGVCLHCTAWKRKGPYYADRVVVKLFYENRRVVRVEAAVDRDAWHPY